MVSRANEIRSQDCANQPPMTDAAAKSMAPHGRSSTDASQSKTVVSDAGQSSQIEGWLVAAAMVAATFLAYLPCWFGSWLWDDDILLLHNPVIQPGGLAKIWVPGGYLDYWPLTYTAYWLQNHLWNLQPLGYHLVNIALHAFAAVLVWRILTCLRVPGAMFAAAIFALHPVNVESVAWIAQLKGILSLVLALTSVLLYLRHEQNGHWRCYAIAIAAFVLSGLAKSESLTLPIVLLALAWWQRGRIARQDVLRILPYFLIAAGMAALAVWGQHSGGSAAARSDSLLSRAAIAGCAVWFYLGKLIWPRNLIPIYPRWTIPVDNVLEYLPAVMLLVALCVAWWYRRTWGRPVVMLIVCYVALLLPVLGFVNITYMKYSLVANHWQYIATIVPCAAAAAACAVLARRFWRRSLARLGCVALLLALSVLTWLQSAVYASPELFYGTTIERNPDCWIAENNLGLVLAGQGKIDAAAMHYRRALQINPSYWLAENNLGVVLARRGENDAAIMHYRKALEFNPRCWLAENNWGVILADRGQGTAAAAHYRKALELNPEYAEAHSNLGSVLLNEGKFDLAVGQLEQALQLDPQTQVANYNLALICGKRGELDLAIRHLQQELEINPDFELARQKLAAVVAYRGQVVKALDEVRERLQQAPNDPDLLDQGAWILATSPYASIRNGGESVAMAERASKIAGSDNPKQLGTLAAAYAEAGRFREAVVAAEKALRSAEIAGNDNLAAQLSACLAQYRSGKPFRDTR